MAWKKGKKYLHKQFSSLFCADEAVFEVTWLGIQFLLFDLIYSSIEHCFKSRNCFPIFGLEPHPKCKYCDRMPQIRECFEDKVKWHQKKTSPLKTCLSNNDIFVRIGTKRTILNQSGDVFDQSEWNIKVRPCLSDWAKVAPHLFSGLGQS